MNHNRLLFLNSISSMINVMFYTSMISVYFQNNITSQYGSIAAILTTLSQIIALSPKVEKIIMRQNITNKMLMKIFIFSDITFITAMVLAYNLGWLGIYYIAAPICFSLIASIGNKMYKRRLNNILSGDKLFKYDYKIQRWNNYGMLIGSVLAYITVSLLHINNMYFMNIVMFTMGILIESITDVLLLESALYYKNN